MPVVQKEPQVILDLDFVGHLLSACEGRAHDGNEHLQKDGVDVHTCEDEEEVEETALGSFS